MKHHRLPLAVAAAALAFPAIAQGVVPEASVQQGGVSHALTFGGGCVRGPDASICSDPPTAFAAQYVDIDAALGFTVHFSDEINAVRVFARVPGGTDAAVPARVIDAHTAQVTPLTPLPGRLVVSASPTAGGDETFAGELPHVLLATPVSSGDICPRPTQLRVTDAVSGAPVRDAAVGRATSDANGLVPYPTDGSRATKAGYTSSTPTVFAEPAILCLTAPQPQPQPAPQTTPATAAKLTLKAATGLKLGDLRFTAGSNRAVSAKLSAKVGGLTIKRSLVFSQAGRKTFKFSTNGPQNQRIRHALAMGSVHVRATITGNGTSATASARLRR